MGLRKLFLPFLAILIVTSASCLRYSFTGTSIPEGVNTIFIPFFPDQSNSGLGDLSDRLNEELIDRFVNQSRLTLANDEESADAVINGSITSYSNRPFSISGNEQASQNQVSIGVKATFKYSTEEEAVYNKNFNGNFTFDPTEDPVAGENEAISEALQQIANNMFNDAVSSW